MFLCAGNLSKASRLLKLRLALLCSVVPRRLATLGVFDFSTLHGLGFDGGLMWQKENAHKNLMKNPFESFRLLSPSLAAFRVFFPSLSLFFPPSYISRHITPICLEYLRVVFVAQDRPYDQIKCNQTSLVQKRTCNLSVSRFCSLQMGDARIRNTSVGV